MRKTIGLFLIILLCVARAWAFDIRGVVQTAKGKPIFEAVVLHRDSGKKTLSDEKGVFTLSLPEDAKIVLEVIHPDYIEQEIAISQKDLKKKIIVTLSPYIRQQEEVVVTALRYPESSATVPAAETVVTEESLEEKIAPNIAQGLLDLPGVSNIGAGGFSLVPNIRGLARRRVLILIDNARVTSDRRTGPSASFVSPKDIKTIEVLRSPSSVFYGSDAIGGVVHILTKEAPLSDGIGGTLSAKYGTINEEKGLGFSLEGKKNHTGFFLSLHGTSAQNYTSPEKEILMSKFTQGSLFGKLSYKIEKREIHVSFLGARGKEVGKPNKDSLSKPTWYPMESQNFIQLQWVERDVGGSGDINFQAWLNPNSLETQKEKLKSYKVSESTSKTESLDYGFHLSYGKKIGKHFRLKAGADWFGRTDSRAINRNKTFDPSGNITDVYEESPYSDGKRRDLGIFISADYEGIQRLDIVGGIRADFIHLEALPGGYSGIEESSYSAFTGFLGGTFKIAPSIVFFTNLAHAYRAPSLNELFYSGITGRGLIIAQPGLKPEMSYNLDIGLKIIQNRFFVGAYAFYYLIDDMIERYLVEESVYTYGNVNRGEIRGYEIELEYYPIPGWRIFGNFFSFKGKSLNSDDYLNDVPPHRLYLGTKFWLRRLSLELNATLQGKKSNPGPAEVAIPGYEILGFKASYFIASTVQCYVVLSNLTNSLYIARPDPSAVQEPGRNVLIGLNFSF
jgi:outer membrane receptor protein involved in Fe transport